MTDELGCVWGGENKTLYLRDWFGVSKSHAGLYQDGGELFAMDGWAPRGFDSAAESTPFVLGGGVDDR